MDRLVERTKGLGKKQKTGVRPSHQTFTPLNTSIQKILHEIKNEPYLEWLQPMHRGSKIRASIALTITIRAIEPEIANPFETK